MHRWFNPIMFSTMLGQSSLSQLVTLLQEHSPQCLLFTEANFGFPAWCHFRWTQLVLGWMAAALRAVFQGKAAHIMVSELRSHGVASFWFPLSKLCPASEFQGLGEKHLQTPKALICSCLHESKSLAIRWEDSQKKWDSVEHNYEKHLWEKHT